MDLWIGNLFIGCVDEHYFCEVRHTVNIKQPLMLDTSYWETIPNFADISPRPLFVATKATEGGSYVDPTFSKYFADIKQDGIYRSAFHFFRKAANSASQAQLYINTVRAAGLSQSDVIELDIEETPPPTAIQIISWLDVVEAQFSNLIIIYGRKNILDKISMTATQKARLRNYPIWTAGYPINPDLFDSPPAIYIPDQTKWGEVWAWQYSEHGKVVGIVGDVDLDWMSPKLVSYLTGVTGMTRYGTVNANGVNIRSTPVVSTTNDIGDLNTNDKVEASEIVGGWWHLTKINGVATKTTSWASGAYITETAAPVPLPADNSAVLEAIAGVKADVDALAGAGVTILQKLDAILGKLDAQTPPTPPPAVDDGYTGPTLGIYKIISTGNSNNSFQPLNGDGGYSTPMQDKTVDWMAANCPGWDNFVHPSGSVEPVVTYNGKLWYITSKAILGEKVKVAEIVKGRARIVGMDADGDPKFSAVNLSACSPTKTPHYFHHIPNVNRYYPIIQPRGKDAGGYPQSWWIETWKLEKVP